MILYDTAWVLNIKKARHYNRLFIWITLAGYFAAFTSQWLIARILPVWFNFAYGL
jgi:hypothetical protein